MSQVIQNIGKLTAFELGYSTDTLQITKKQGLQMMATNAYTKNRYGITKTKVYYKYTQRIF